jgi:hypothetical protein
MASGLTLDSGALIAASRDDRRFWAFWKRSLQRAVPVTVPAPVLAQVWRGNHPLIARLLTACVVEPLDEIRARKVGELLASSRTSDVVDAAVVISAAGRGDAVVTSDGEDIDRLVRAIRRPLRILPV